MSQVLLLKKMGLLTLLLMPQAQAQMILCLLKLKCLPDGAWLTLTVEHTIQQQVFGRLQQRQALTFWEGQKLPLLRIAILMRAVLILQLQRRTQSMVRLEHLQGHTVS